MEINTIATKADIQQVKTEIIALLNETVKQVSATGKKWLKSNEVMELLGISSSGLQNLRINGTIPFTKLGGIIYYDYQEIISILNKNKKNAD